MLCEWTGFLLSCDAKKNALVAIDNSEKVVSCGPFIRQFIRNMSVYKAERYKLRGEDSVDL